MVRISRAVEYALIAVQYMEEHPLELVTARELSDRFSLPAGLIAKILQRLATAGILQSEQGVRGGYRLARELGTVSLLTLSEAVEGPMRPTACDTDGAGGCDRSEACTVADPIHALSARIVDMFAQTDLESLLHTEQDPQQGAHV